jgi:hypothetical protein
MKDVLLEGAERLVHRTARLSLPSSSTQRLTEQLAKPQEPLVGVNERALVDAERVHRLPRRGFAHTKALCRESKLGCLFTNRLRQEREEACLGNESASVSTKALLVDDEPLSRW